LDGSLALWRYAQGSRDRIGRPVTETLWRPARRPISRGSRGGIRESSAGTRQRALAPGGPAATGRGQWLTARSALARAFPRLAGDRSRRVDDRRWRGGPRTSRCRLTFLRATRFPFGARSFSSAPLIHTDPIQTAAIAANVRILYRTHLSLCGVQLPDFKRVPLSIQQEQVEYNPLSTIST
jgi:hypothetical protein